MSQCWASEGTWIHTWLPFSQSGYWGGKESSIVKVGRGKKQEKEEGGSFGYKTCWVEWIQPWYSSSRWHASTLPGQVLLHDSSQEPTHRQSPAILHWGPWDSMGLWPNGSWWEYWEEFEGTRQVRGNGLPSPASGTSPPPITPSQKYLTTLGGYTYCLAAIT